MAAGKSAESPRESRCDAHQICPPGLLFGFPTNAASRIARILLAALLIPQFAGVTSQRTLPTLHFSAERLRFSVEMQYKVGGPR